MKNLIQEYVYDAKGKVSSRKLTKPYLDRVCPGLWDKILEATCFYENASMSERVWMVMNDITERRACYCGKPVRVTTDTKTNERRLSDYCSTSCYHKSPSKKEKIRAAHISRPKELVKKANLAREETCRRKYGVNHSNQRKDKPKAESKLVGVNDNALSKLKDRDWMHTEYQEKKRSASDIANDLGVFYGTVISYCELHGFSIRNSGSKSRQERELQEYVISLVGEELVITNTRRIIAPLELDVYVPSKNLAIEMNGLFHHSDAGGKDPAYHLNKTLKCSDAGITLIHFDSEQWDTKREIVQDIIKHKLGLTKTKVYARKCVSRLATKTEEKKFFNNNHIQGHVGSNICYALVHNGSIVAMMSFGKPRFSSGAQWELLRFACSLGTSVVGASSKLLSVFMREHSGSIISYCNRMISSGRVYRASGFDLKRITGPGYYYTDGYKRFNRMQFQKHKLATVLKKFDPSKTEYENMKENGFHRYWDCGQYVFIIENP